MVGRKRQRVAVHRRIVARKQRQERNKHTQAGATQDPNEACPTLVLVLGMTEGLDLQLALEYCLCQWGYEVSADIGKRGSSENASSGVAGPRNDLTSSWYRLVNSVAKDRNNEIRRMHWMCLDAKAPFEAVLDAAKVADLGLLLYVEQRAVEETAEAWLDSIRAQGLMSCIAVAVPPLVRSMTATSDHAMVLESNHSESYLSGGSLALGSVEDSPASRPWLACCNDRLAAASILDAKEKPIQVRIMRSRGDAEQIRRQLEHAKRRVIRWRADRPYMLVEQVFIESDSDSTECSVRIIGWLRGAGTNARRLVHLTGMGTFVVSRIERAQVPFLGPLFGTRRNNSVRMDGIEASELVLDEADDPSEAYAMVSGMQIEDTVPADWRDDVSDNGMGPVQTSANAQTKQTPSFGSRSPNEDILVGEAAEEATLAHCPWALPPNRAGIHERALNEMSYEDCGIPALIPRAPS
ncbi:ribosome bioproteinsis protein tsr1 [Cyanidiococcus yangmingshanensis]|uniref:Ribosome bioproteinsis protein tsr1 n=1 Tax=Cyanidiococcus yangmingshanensis TaxID=2690220 RepID=A0A7J7IBL0_9RHOD|nr:ribosome bioproteinsis protein tsr1 [Cyanidiococcus yangmingshanensis]